jgi:hypothetical protein
MSTTDTNVRLKPAKVLSLKKSLDGRHATIIVDVFDVKERKDKITIFSGCEIRPDGRFCKDISGRNFGIKELIF